MQTLSEDLMLSYAKPAFACFALEALTRRFVLKKQHFSKGYIAEPHFHDFPQLWYCGGGSYTHTVDGEEKVYTKGSLVIVPPGRVHGFFVEDQGGAELTKIDISFGFFQNVDMVSYIYSATYLFLLGYGKDMQMDIPFGYQLKEDAQKSMHTLLRVLEQEQKTNECNAQKIYSAMEEFFRNEEFSLPKQNARALCKLIDNKVAPVLRVLRFVNEKWAEKITVEEALEISAFSRSSFFVHFKTFTGLSFKGYLQYLRCNYINLLLGTTNYPVSYISDICGFSNRSHMLKAYKKLEDDTPIKMRDKYREYYTDQDAAMMKPLLEHIV